MRVGNSVTPFCRRSLPLILVERMIAVCTTQRDILEAQQRPTKLLECPTTRAGKKVTPPRAVFEMSGDSALAFERRLTESQNLEIGPES
jgi:hypothetical protein